MGIFLKAKVEAVNRGNAYANELHPKLVEVLEPFVGKKVLKKDGEVTKEVGKAIDHLMPSTAPLSIYRSQYDSRLEWVVKTRVSYDCGCVYYESSVYVANVENGILTSLNKQPPNYRTDYNVEEVERKREVYRQLKEQLNNAESELNPFGVYNR